MNVFLSSSYMYIKWTHVYSGLLIWLGLVMGIWVGRPCKGGEAAKRSLVVQVPWPEHSPWPPALLLLEQPPSEQCFPFHPRWQIQVPFWKKGCCKPELQRSLSFALFWPILQAILSRGSQIHIRENKQVLASRYLKRGDMQLKLGQKINTLKHSKLTSKYRKDQNILALRKVVFN